MQYFSKTLNFWNQNYCIESRYSMIILYYNCLWLVIMYGSDISTVHTCTLTKGDSERVYSFDRKLLQTIYRLYFNSEIQIYDRWNNEDLQRFKISSMFYNLLGVNL